jgi:hypothetical protein
MADPCPETPNQKPRSTYDFPDLDEQGLVPSASMSSAATAERAAVAA